MIFSLHFEANRLAHWPAIGCCSTLLRLRAREFKSDVHKRLLTSIPCLQLKGFFKGDHTATKACPIGWRRRKLANSACTSWKTTSNQSKRMLCKWGAGSTKTNAKNSSQTGRQVACNYAFSCLIEGKTNWNLQTKTTQKKYKQRLVEC